VNELALFAGAGGGILGGKLLGWRTVCAVEIDPYARRVLLARQADGCLDPFPIWDDVTTFDGHPWRGRVDVVSGGFPCQDISSIGAGQGLDGDRSGLWAEMARIIGEVQPRFAFVENSPMLTLRGLDRVCGDLAALGYDARWGVVSAADAGAPHLRERIWIVAHTVRHQLRLDQAKQERRHQTAGSVGDAADAEMLIRLHKSDDWQDAQRLPDNQITWRTSPWDEATPKVCGVDDGVADRLDRMHAIGNGQVPAVAAFAWRILTAGLPTIGNEASMSVQRLETCMPNVKLSRTFECRLE